MAELPEEYVAVLVDLAEGRFEPEQWLAWWEKHAADLKRVCLPGWFLRLKPGQPENGIDRAVLISQTGASEVLTKLGVECSFSLRYQNAWNQECERTREEEEAAAAARAIELDPIIDSLSSNFPKFARFLRRNALRVEHVQPGISDAALDEMTVRLGVELPETYRIFLKSVREIVFGDTLQMTMTHPFIYETDGDSPVESMLCIADYWLQGDGDQVTFNLREHAGGDPPVFYYAHEQRPPTVKRLSKQFTCWIESLPRKLVD
ncbi:MAG: SMI1/KNR4 family protein [Pirellulales bacterium]|nr:SMI1/KNR4 family protein [Pirellulales bacterium]